MSDTPSLGPLPKAVDKEHKRLPLSAPLWKTLVTYADSLDDGEAATAGPRRILGEIFADHAGGESAIPSTV